MIQEFNYGTNSTADIRGFVDTAFGSSFYYYRGGGGVQIPNGVISRYPILASGDWTDTQVSNRAFTWARIDIPGPTDLWAISVHLLTSSAGVRNTEATNLVKFIQTNVPAGAYVAIGGDYNSDSRSEALFSTFSSVVSTASPYPADKNNNNNTNAGRAKPYDHVLVSANLRSYQTSTVIGASSFASGLVVDTRVYSPLSEISPAQSGDSGSTNMQHMAVVKDFAVPQLMRIAVASTGSEGDIRPMLALLRGLRGAGHEAFLVASPLHAARAREADIPLRPVGPALGPEEFDRRVREVMPGIINERSPDASGPGALWPHRERPARGAARGARGGARGGSARAQFAGRRGLRRRARPRHAPGLHALLPWPPAPEPCAAGWV